MHINISISLSTIFDTFFCHHEHSRRDLRFIELHGDAVDTIAVVIVDIIA